MIRSVLIICDKSPCTSFGRLSLDMRESLERGGFKAEIVWLVTPRYFPAGAPAGSVSVAARSMLFGLLQFAPQLAKVFRRLGPELVLFIRPELGFLVPLARKVLPGAKAVVMIHDTFAETLYPKSRKFKLINRFFIRETRTADSFIYNSEYTRSVSNSFFGFPKIPGAVVGCAINTAIFHPGEASKGKEERQKFWAAQGIKGFKGVCMNVSLDEPRKNLGTFFKVAAMRPEVAFVRIGRLRKGTAEALKKSRLPNLFHFQNLPVELLANFYRHSDLFMYPSFLEGFGMPPLEAIACGTPVAAADTSGVAENLKGVAPLVNPPDDAGAYAKILDQALAGRNLVNTAQAKALLQKASLEAFSERICSYVRGLPSKAL